jgi:competence protein ComEA
MLKKLLVLFALLLPFAPVWAVDVNAATEVQLQDVRGIGPSTARAIVKERTDGGPFKSVEDLAERVKGIGPKSLVKLQAEGLTVGGAAQPAALKGGAPAAASGAKGK